MIATINVEDELVNLVSTGRENKIEQEAAGKNFHYFFLNYVNIRVYFNIHVIVFLLYIYLCGGLRGNVRNLYTRWYRSDTKDTIIRAAVDPSIFK